MRGQASPGVLSDPQAGRAALRVLLATEGFPAASRTGSGLGDLTETLVRQMPEVEFVVWSLGSVGPGERRGELPSNVSRVVEVAPPGAESGAAREPRDRDRELGDRGRGRGRDRGRGRRGGRKAPRVADRDVERAFIPLFHDLLAEITGGDFDPDRFARLLSALRAHFQVWDYRATWRSRAVWDAFRERAASATQLPGEHDGDALIASAWTFPGEPEGPLGQQAPTVGESAEAIRFLYRSLWPVTAELPVTDLAHATSGGLCAIPCILAKVERETPFLLTEATVYLREQYLALARDGLPFPLKRLLLRFSSALAQTTYHLADRVAPVCEWVGQWERTYGVPAGRIDVIYPGVDGEMFRPMPITRSPRPTVVSFASVAPAEDQETMLEVADRVRRAIPDVLFLHHGPVTDQSYWERVRALCRERLLEDTVKFMGPTERAAAAFTSADVTLSTSTWEGFPPTIIESLACGTPVVATAVGGVHEALDGPGVTAPPGDAERLAQAVVAILRLPADQRELLKEAARSTAVERFALSTFVDRYRAGYRTLTGLPAEPVAVPQMEQEEEMPAMGPVTEVQKAPAPAPAAIAAPVPLAPPMPRPAAASIWAPPPESRRTPLLWEVPPPEPVVPARAMQQPAPEPVQPALSAAPEDRPLPDAAAMAEAAPTPAARPLHAVPAGMEPDELRLAMQDDDPFVRVGALSRAGDGPDAFDVAGEALADDFPQVRREAVRALARIGGPVVGRALAETLAHDPSSEVREEAVAALAALLARRVRGRESGA